MGNLGFTTPFHENIMRACTPRKVKVPPIDHYDGTTDPIDHLAAFKAQMSVQTSSEAAWCKFFPTTLKGLALTWFTELPYGSISSFTALETAFKQNFIAGRRHRKTSIHLMSIRQRREEDLAEYIKRFNAESLKVSDLQDSVAFTALMSGLYPSSRFKLKLAESEASSFSEAMNLAQKFIQASDICKTHEEPSSGKRKHEYTPRTDNPRDTPRKEKDKKPRLENHWNDPRYNLNQREIYLDIKGKYPLPKPHLIRTSFNKRDKKLWCEFHHDCGHTTRECRELKRALDKLADEGKLNRYLKDPKESKVEPRAEKQARSDDTAGYINVIAGGLHHDCGHTTRECRELKRALDKLADEGKLNRYLKDPKESKVEPRAEKQARSDDTAGYINVIAGGFASGGLTIRSRKKHLYTLKHGSDANSTATCPTMTFKTVAPIQTRMTTRWLSR
ncbi:uncharacterized protein LOC104899028 [Beta vulgaris subsp. vulgaris]|uniref:uncharacterized protein LOC104899028 n=1 Tax=Beta vulgaris subsp. vulgaris TaxID=3555 RepID=UPI002547E8CF|nr:uncharacterized protein LOC104899028 [Beta vulgaris subsp. vulgaris]